MTSETAFPQRLTKIDELMRCDHAHLNEDDECYFIGEYTARMGYAYSATNNLVLNFKKTLDRQGLSEWHYKEKAIKEAAAAFATALEPSVQKTLDRVTFVPVPPSKARDDPLHDDRLTQMLNLVRPEPGLAVREVIVQECSTDAVHSSESRLRPDEIEAMYSIDEALTKPVPGVLAVVDDVLTTGAHFRAAQTVLASRFPATKIIGLFIARRIPDTSDFDEFET